MPRIKPVSDLRSYNEVLKDVHEGSPVFLTKNGRGRYVIVDIHDYDKAEAIRILNEEIDRGRASGEQEGWHSVEDVRETLEKRAEY
ncbi:MAG: type II toxin-antitoxin system prevent-host-death family antitoxin [Ancrocorticia sp.]|uniref:type II toxin-antitoxin system prevent-host-death family antitoxin n=1 Tax=Ancrocorticia sp. TaxID=2593684 RepID=UPI003F8F8E75